MIYHGARHHKGSANSRSRKRSSHNQGRKPDYKELRRSAEASKLKICDRCGDTKPLTAFSKTGRTGARTQENTSARCRDCLMELGKEYVARQRLTYAALVERNRIERARPYVPISAAELLKRPPIPFWLHTRWNDQTTGDLKVLCLASVPIDQAADVLGRSPTSIAWRARDLRLELPQEWSRLIAPKRVIKPRLPRFILKYPYLAKARPSDSDLLRVNNLVPHHFPDWVRADVAQSVLLAFYEGDVSIAELEAHKDDMRWFYKKYYREQSPHEEVQIAGGPDDDRSYDEIAESRRYYQTLERHEDPGQIAYVWERERSAARFLMAGKIANLKDVDYMLESGEIKIADLKPQLFRPWDRIRKHARDRLKERFGIELSQDQAEKLVVFCRQRQADDRDRHRELHIFRSGRLELPVVYDRRVNEIVSILPEGGGLGGAEFAPNSVRAIRPNGSSPAVAGDNFSGHGSDVHHDKAGTSRPGRLIEDAMSD